MARDPDEIARSMAETTALVNPKADVRKGPIYDTAHVPWSAEMAANEAAIEHLGQLYQAERADQWTSEEIAAFGRDYGMSFSSGDPSQGYLTFYAYEITADIMLEEGAIASTEDGIYQYKSLTRAVMYAANAAAYFVASRRRYEITVPGEGVEIGPDYDAAAGRVKVLQTPITGIAGVVGGEFRGGTTTQNLQEYVDDIQQLLLGNSVGCPGGLVNIAIRFSSGAVEDVAVLTPADIGVFERLPIGSMRAAIDIYVTGFRLGIAEHTYVTAGAETVIILPEVPVLGITTVLVDGVPTAYTLVKDSASATRGSVFANDAVVLTTAPGPGHNVFVNYTFNKLVVDLHNRVNEIEEQLFQTSTYVREGKSVDVDVELAITSYGAGTRVSEVEAFIARWFRDSTLLTSRQHFPAELDPRAFGDDLQSKLSVSAKLTKFNRPDRATMLVQPMIFAKHEFPAVALRVVAI